MNTPDTEKSYQEKELDYQMKATGNRSQTATPDTEWETEFIQRFETVYDPDPDDIKDFIHQELQKAREERDTYWKERVRKVVEGMKIYSSKPETLDDFETLINETLDDVLDNLK